MTQPTPANDFLVTNDTPLDPTTLTAVFQSLWFRIKDLQEIAAGFEHAVSQSAIELANGKLDLSVAPALNALNARVGEITALMVDAEDRLAALQNGGVAAENVPIGPIDGFPANTNAAQAFALVANALGGISEALSEITPLVESAQQRDEKNQPNGYAGLGSNGKVLANLLGTKVVPVVMTSSGQFLKEADDIGYYVELIGGGQSGRTGGNQGTSDRGHAGGLPGRQVAGLFSASEVPASVTVTVGAGGVAQAVQDHQVNGGNTSFGSLLVALGGGGAVPRMDQNYATPQDVVNAISPGLVYTQGPKSAAGGYAMNSSGGKAGDGYVPLGSTGAAAPGGTYAGSSAGAHGLDATAPGGGGGGGFGYQYGATNKGNGGNGAAPGGGGGSGAGYNPNYGAAFGKGGNGGRGEARILRIKG